MTSINDHGSKSKPLFPGNLSGGLQDSAAIPLTAMLSCMVQTKRKSLGETKNNRLSWNVRSISRESLSSTIQEVLALVEEDDDDDDAFVASPVTRIHKKQRVQGKDSPSASPKQ